MGHRCVFFDARKAEVCHLHVPLFIHLVYTRRTWRLYFFLLNITHLSALSLSLSDQYECVALERMHTSRLEGLRLRCTIVGLFEWRKSMPSAAPYSIVSLSFQVSLIEERLLYSTSFKLPLLIYSVTMQRLGRWMHAPAQNTSRLTSVLLQLCVCVCVYIYMYVKHRAERIMDGWTECSLCSLHSQESREQLGGRYCILIIM